MDAKTLTKITARIKKANNSMSCMGAMLLSYELAAMPWAERMSVLAHCQAKGISVEQFKGVLTGATKLLPDEKAV